uniref:Putative tyrosine-protein phosphatase non-receptor type 23 n=1 Tax=Culex tarsalis TaxID=7177 RepID=A0A1Q3FGM0_CULTA
MEAVPRMPMVSFDLKSSPEPTSFEPLKQYIAEYYDEDPDSYSKECYQLDQLRNAATRPTQDVEGTALMKRYYCQLHSIQNRFLLNQLPESQQMLQFGWRDLYAGSTQKSTIKFEMAVVLHNFGALHTQLGAAEARSDPESMKKACTHFQCAAWAFGFIKDNYALLLQGDLCTEVLIFKQALCFAQAQECIMEKSLCDNRKSGIIAKVTAQIVTYYNSALAALLTQNGEDGRIQDIVGSKQFKEWRKYVKFKISYLSCILLLYQGQQVEEQQKMGERVTLYQASFDRLEEARKESKGLAHIDQVNDALQFTMDVVEAKRKSAKNENEFIYHEEVPELGSIAAVQGANLVHGIGFDVTDPDAMGDDIFHRLVPMKAHESSSVYSEEKATLLRTMGTKVEDKDAELSSFMSSLSLDSINLQHPSGGPNDSRLPQGLVDRCADLNAKPNAIPDLVQSMSSLAETCADVEVMLKEIKQLLRQDEIQEDSYQQKIGQRSNGGGHIAELSREFGKYQEAHNKAGESNDTLRKAMGLHVHNLKILAQPLRDIKEQIPVSGEQFDEGTLSELRGILGKVNEMRKQRAKLYQELRTNIANDDITSQLIALESGGSDGKKRMQELFRKELGKHDQLVALLDANLKAQGNILKALTDIYARCAPIIKAISEAKTKREQFFSSLQGSYDVYEDLLSKSAKGLEFYRKLQGNVQKLYSRVKAACDVQDEERNQKLKSSSLAKKVQDVAKEGGPKVSGGGGGPKLKDYLKSGNITLGSIKASGVDTNATSAYIPPVRPTPVGSESTAPASSSGAGAYYQDSYANYNYYSAAATAANTASDYSQYYQQQQMTYGQTMPTATFQSVQPTNTVSQSQPGTTGYVNPIYQSSAGYYNGRQSLDYGQYPAAQPSPAPSSASSNEVAPAAPPQQQWNSMTQQFGAMNLQQTTVDPASYSTSYQQPDPQQQQQQQYAAQNGQSYAGYNAQYYQQPSPVPQQQYPQPQATPQPVVQEAPKAQEPAVAASYPSPYPGYTYNPQTGGYDYTGQYSQASYPGQYIAAQPTNTLASTTADTGTATTGMYYGTQPTTATSYDYSQQQQPQPTTTVEPTPYYDYQQAQQPAQPVQDPSQQYYQQGQTQTPYYGYQQPTVDSAQPSTQYSSYPPQTSTAAYAATYQQQPPPPVEQPPATPAVTAPTPQPAVVTAAASLPKRSSNLDLLSGIDFTPAPVAAPVLQPQQPAAAAPAPADDDIKSEVLTPTKAQPAVVPASAPAPPAVAIDRKPSLDNLSLCSELSSIDQNFDWESASLRAVAEQPPVAAAAQLAPVAGSAVAPSGSILVESVRDPFEDQATLKWFHKEVERLEKFCESLNVKTLNGTTPLDGKWKELQDMLVKEESKRQVGVAKLFPEKNRSIDCVPYDHARVTLPTVTDNYINAVYVKDLGFGCPQMILAQTPLQNTVNDYWNMIWSQKSNLVVCLHTPTEILDTFWPTELNQELSYGDVSVTLIKQFDLTHCIERALRVTMLGSDVILNVSLLQNKQWPRQTGSAEYLLGIAQNVIGAYRQQNQGQKQHKPLIVNCLNGSDRSSLLAVAVAAILATQTRKPILINIVDIWYRMCCQRKGALRDPSHIQLSYQIVLANGHSILNKRGIMTSYQMKSVQATAAAEKEEAINDPFKDLDPLWKLK